MQALLLVVCSLIHTTSNKDNLSVATYHHAFRLLVLLT